MKQHIKAPDPIAAISGGLLALAGMLGIEERFGIVLTPDQVAEAMGLMITIASSVRHWWETRKAGRPMSREELLAELQRLDDELGLSDMAIRAAAAATMDDGEYAGRPHGPEFVSGHSDASDEGAR